MKSYNQMALESVLHGFSLETPANFFIPNLIKSFGLLVPLSIKWGRNSSAYLTVNWGEVSELRYAP